MKKELFDDIASIKPEWFAGLRYGIEAGDGWHALIKKLVVSLHYASLDRPVDFKEFKVVQIKEKFGGLRFYTSTSSFISYFFIHSAERESYTTCEMCGRSGQLGNIGNWLRTTCNDCFKQLTEGRHNEM